MSAGRPRPQLAELEYRIVGRELILLDTAANLIVDLLLDALPASQSER
jgi:hypothetical protein